MSKTWYNIWVVCPYCNNKKLMRVFKNAPPLCSICGKQMNEEKNMGMKNIRFDVWVAFSFIINATEESLNTYMSEKYSRQVCWDVIIMDISYELLRSDLGSQEVYIRVRGFIAVEED